MSRTRGKKIVYEEIESSDDELSRLELDALAEYEGDDDGSHVTVNKSRGSLKVTISFDDTEKLAKFNVKQKKSSSKDNKDKRSKTKKQSPIVAESLDEDEDLNDEIIDEELDLDDEEGDVIPVDYDDDEEEDEEDEDLFDYDDEGNKNVDLSKLSDRQRAKYLGQSEEPDDFKNGIGIVDNKNLPKSVLMLMDGNQKKQLSEEEIELRKADAARKRKHFVMKKLEAEKKETLRKLLHRKVEKVDSRKQDEENEKNRLNKLKRAELLKHRALFSWVSKIEGTGNEKCTVSYYSMQ